MKYLFYFIFIPVFIFLISNCGGDIVREVYIDKIVNVPVSVPPSNNEPNRPIARPATACMPANLTGPEYDRDSDGIANYELLNTMLQDNCPLVPNRNQLDTNGNGVGDACEDTDSDCIYDLNDNCLSVVNTNQSNIDNDTFGDACDVDANNNGLVDINYIDDLESLRHNSNGYGLQRTAASTPNYMGCQLNAWRLNSDNSITRTQPTNADLPNYTAIKVCEGYDLRRTLDFNDVNSYYNNTINKSYVPVNVTGTIVTPAAGINAGWPPIILGSLNGSFIFNGNNFSIKNLYIRGNLGDKLGFFGEHLTASLSLTKFSIIGADIYFAGSDSVGTIAPNLGFITCTECSVENVRINSSTAYQDSFVVGSLFGTVGQSADVNKSIISLSSAKNITLNIDFANANGGTTKSIQVGGFIGEHLFSSVIVNSYVNTLNITTTNTPAATPSVYYIAGFSANKAGPTGFILNSYVKNLNINASSITIFSASRPNHGVYGFSGLGSASGGIGQFGQNNRSTYVTGNITTSNTMVAGYGVRVNSSTANRNWVQDSYAVVNITTSINPCITGRYISGFISMPSDNTLITNVYAAGNINFTGTVGGTPLCSLNKVLVAATHTYINVFFNNSSTITGNAGLSVVNPMGVSGKTTAELQALTLQGMRSISGDYHKILMWTGRGADNVYATADDTYSTELVPGQ